MTISRADGARRRQTARNERRARFSIERRDGTRAVVELRGREALVEGRSGGAHGSMRDITELDELERRLRARTAELERVVQVQRTLGEISRRIVEVADSSEVLQQVVDAASSLLGSDGAHLTLMNDEGPTWSRW